MPSASPAPDQGTPCGYCGKKSSTLLPRGDMWACVDCYLARPENMYEIKARMKRVLALTELLVRRGGGPVAARAMTDSDWKLLAMEAKIGKPPSLETREMVLTQLEIYRRYTNGV